MVLTVSVVLDGVAQSTTDSLTFHVYVGGKPDRGWIEARNIVANRWGFKTEFFYGDCGGTFDFKAKEFEVLNQPVFEWLSTHYGQDWKEKFDAEMKEVVESRRSR
jgi:hypothetical protein